MFYGVLTRKNRAPFVAGIAMEAIEPSPEKFVKKVQSVSVKFVWY